jgi:hypothetical protein
MELAVMAGLATACILAAAAFLWILEAPLKVRIWLDKHSR